MNVEFRSPRPETLPARDHVETTLAQCNPLNRRVYELNSTMTDIYRGSPAPAEVHRSAQDVIERIERLQFNMEELPDKLKKRDPSAREMVHKICTGWKDVATEVGSLVEKINGWDPQFSEHARELQAAVAQLAEQIQKLEA